MKKATLTEGKIGWQLFHLTWPMVFGMLGLVIFNLVDTFFIGKLGVDQLAAMGFTFPVITVINGFALGLGIGSSALVSRAIGQNNHKKAARLTTDAIGLALFLAALISLVGSLTIDPLFTLLGASPQVLIYIKDYMGIWYLGLVFVVVPMVGNSAIRATGDTKTPAKIMVVAGLSNALFDYLLIFGIGIFPVMGMAGAALATVMGRFMTSVVALLTLYRREGLLVFTKTKFSLLVAHWKELLEIGLPVALGRMIQPLTIGILTGLLSVFGSPVVAGFGVASRLEMFLTMVIRSFVSVLGPFAGQNYGAGKMSRLQKARELAVTFSVIYGLLISAFLWLFASPLVGLFTDDPQAAYYAALYLRTVSLAYIFFGILHASASIFNVTGRPKLSALLMVLQMLGICVPLAYLLRGPMGPRGVFLALAISWLIMGVFSILLNGRHLKELAQIHD